VWIAFFMEKFWSLPFEQMSFRTLESFEKRMFEKSWEELR